MRIGVPKEIKNKEHRVGLTHICAKSLVEKGHHVVVETQAGAACGIDDSMYQAAGATVLPKAALVWQEAELIIKVKEPMPQEFVFLTPGQIVYTFLHLAAEPQLTKALLDQQVTGVAYETVQTADNTLPLLTPMSEVAGRMATQVGAFLLQKSEQGKGILLGGATGVRPAVVSIIGAGVAGTHAAKMALGLGAQVNLLDIRRERLSYLADTLSGKVQLLYSNAANIAHCVKNSDLLIGAVLLTGQKAPCLVSRKLVGRMEAGSVVVDVCVDQGGCVESCRPTTHEAPTYTVDGVVHYCVTNMPGAVPRTSTYALTQETLAYAHKIADRGIEKACLECEPLKKGLNTYKGRLTNKEVATSLGLDYTDTSTLLA